MSRYHSYISSAVIILGEYKGTEPFVHFSKKYFAGHKKYGSRDRKMITHLCYCYFRCFHLFKNMDTKEAVVHALFLCEENNHPLLEDIVPALNEKITLPVKEKLAFLELVEKDIFPFFPSLGAAVNNDEFCLSFLRQPLLFLRVRPGKNKQVFSKLTSHNIHYSLPDDDCIALVNATGIQDILQINREVVVQDRISQQVFGPAIKKGLFSAIAPKPQVWDCCAASGGKSILLYDKLKGQIKLTVSDIRKSILHNLQQRMNDAGIPVYRSFIADISSSIPREMDGPMDIIICDAPCTGSGTWSRTPEQLAFFTEGKIEEYAVLQKNIARNASAHLKNEGLFFYITCSVFKKENEEVVETLQKETALKLLHAQYLPGYHEQADTMFVAVFKNNSHTEDGE